MYSTGKIISGKIALVKNEIKKSGLNTAAFNEVKAKF
jgi:hypothetical protein